jgi:hypothetical protein
MPDADLLAVQTLARVDPDFRALVAFAYPGLDADEVWAEVFAKDMPDPSSMHVPQLMAPRSSTKKKTLEAIGIGATAIGAGLGLKDSVETGKEALSAIKTGGSIDAKVAGAMGAAPEAPNVGRKVARAAVAPAMLAGDAVAEQQQISSSRKKPLVALPTSGMSKGALADLTNTFIDSGARAAKNVYQGLRGGETSTGVLRPIKTGESAGAKAATAEKPVAAAVETPPAAAATAPVNPIVSGQKAYQVGQYATTPTGKKVIGGSLASALLLGHHERNVGANQAYAAQYGKADTEWYADIAKTDVAKRQVFGYASVVRKDGLPVTDRQGDIIEPDEMENAAYDFVLNSRVGGNMHKRDAFNRPHHVSDLIESFAVTPAKLEGLGVPAQIAKSVPVGWWVGFKVWDDDAWQDVVDGKLSGFSIHGQGVRVPVADEELWT